MSLLKQTDEKLVNIVLAELLKEALSYQRILRHEVKSPKQKAIYKALWVTSVSRYNKVTRALGHLGSSKLAKYPEILLQPLSQDPMTEDEIDTLVMETYQTHSHEHRALHAEIERNMALVSVIAPGTSTKVQAAIKTLVNEGMLGKLIDEQKLLSLSPEQLPKSPIVQRGDSEFGGLVNKYMHRGQTNAQARVSAQAELDRRGVSKPEPIPQIQSVSGQLMSVAEAIAQSTPARPKIGPDKMGSSMLNILEHMSSGDLNAESVFVDSDDGFSPEAEGQEPESNTKPHPDDFSSFDSD